MAHNYIFKNEKSTTEITAELLCREAGKESNIEKGKARAAAISQAARKSTNEVKARMVVWRPWQEDVVKFFNTDPLLPDEGDRHIHIFVDIDGGAGKTTLGRKLQQQQPGRVSIIANSEKNRDIAEVLRSNQNAEVVIMDVSRSHKGAINFDILEVRVCK